MELIVIVESMMCEHCKMNVEKAVKNVKGVKKVKINLMDKSVFIKYNEKKANDSLIKKAIVEAGYEVK